MERGRGSKQLRRSQHFLGGAKILPFPAENPPRRVFCGPRPCLPEYGFTLLEMAIAMVIIGLLLSVAVKAKELTANARVRHIIAQQTEIGIAFRGFQERYRALPGDYPGPAAGRNIPDVPMDLGGDGDGVLLNAANHEQTIAWVHLSHAGFLNARYRMATPRDSIGEANTPKNVYGAYLQLAHDSSFATLEGDPPVAPRLSQKTGNLIPVEILAEVDRKIDDGNAGRGAFRYSPFNGAAAAPTSECMSRTTGNWNLAGTTANCGGANLL